MLAFQLFDFAILRIRALELRWLCLGLCWTLIGCRATAPIHVWQPPGVEVPSGAKVALSPVAGEPELSRRLEEALLAQRPAAAADVALFTADQLVVASPFRLASTAHLTNDLTALHSARAAGADILLQGEIVSTDLSLDVLTKSDEAVVEDTGNMNKIFFKRLYQQPKEKEDHHLLLSWRVIDVPTGRTLAAQSFNLNNQSVATQYPDLAFTEHNPAAMLIAGSARETWKSLAPVVTKEEVRLAKPWLQPGAWRVRRGVKAARQGQWQQAEYAWQKVADGWWPSPSAHHNLAIALAAREDFAAAKQELAQSRGFTGYWLPDETLFWLDNRHRLYHQAHGLGKPSEGWAFPEPAEVQPEYLLAEPIDVEDLPWWTAIPLTKPPGWTWHDWLSQAAPW